MAKKKLINKARQALLVPLFDTTGKNPAMKSMAIGEAIEVDEIQFTPQVKVLIARKEFKVMDVPVVMRAAPAPKPKEKED